ncbi:MAG: hypothetical protein U5R31_00150 [Acidimicrobiia bacterium]|nr:hypothetical protein [Acidimicrobiia bacterium]
MGALLEDQSAVPVEGQRRLAALELADGLADDLGPPALGQPGVLVAPQQGLDVGTGREQGGVEPQLLRPLAHPPRR